MIRCLTGRTRTGILLFQAGHTGHIAAVSRLRQVACRAPLRCFLCPRFHLPFLTTSLIGYAMSLSRLISEAPPRSRAFRRHGRRRSITVSSDTWHSFPHLFVSHQIGSSISTRISLVEDAIGALGRLPTSACLSSSGVRGESSAPRLPYYSPNDFIPKRLTLSQRFTGLIT